MGYGLPSVPLPLPRRPCKKSPLALIPHFHPVLSGRFRKKKQTLVFYSPSIIKNVFSTPLPKNTSPLIPGAYPVSQRGSTSLILSFYSKVPTHFALHASSCLPRFYGMACHDLIKYRRTPSYQTPNLSVTHENGILFFSRSGFPQQSCTRRQEGNCCVPDILRPGEVRKDGNLQVYGSKSTAPAFTLRSHFFACRQQQDSRRAGRRGV